MMKKRSLFYVFILIPLLAMASQERDPFVPILVADNDTPPSQSNSQQTDKPSETIKTERDPFMPYIIDAPNVESYKPKEDVLDQNHPLYNIPASDYRIIGTIVSPKDAFVVIKAPDRNEYYLSVGDKIGQERASIDSISIDGITINRNGELMDLAVSNKFEMSNENSK